MKKNVFNWTDEMRLLVLAYYLNHGDTKKNELIKPYCDEFMRISKVELNEENIKIGYSTFKWKVDNFTSIDPKNPKKGLTGSSKRDKEIFKEVCSDQIKIEKIKNMKPDASIKNLNTNFNEINHEENKRIGRIGEEILFNLLQEKIFKKEITFNDLYNKVNKLQISDFTWENKNGESGKAYDFIINSKYYDVKTTTTHSHDNFFVSYNEKKLIDSNTEKLSIIRIILDKNEKLKKIILIENEVLRNMNFKEQGYLVTIKNNI